MFSSLEFFKLFCFVFCFFVLFFWLVVLVLNCIVSHSVIDVNEVPASVAVQRSAFLPAWLCVWERRERGRDGSHAGAARIQQRCDTNLPMFFFFFFFLVLCVVCVCGALALVFLFFLLAPMAHNNSASFL